MLNSRHFFLVQKKPSISVRFKWGYKVIHEHLSLVSWHSWWPKIITWHLDQQLDVLRSVTHPPGICECECTNPNMCGCMQECVQIFVCSWMATWSFSLTFRWQLMLSTAHIFLSWKHRADVRLKWCYISRPHWSAFSSKLKHCKLLENRTLNAQIMIICFPVGMPSAKYFDKSSNIILLKFVKWEQNSWHTKYFCTLL